MDNITKEKWNQKSDDPKEVMTLKYVANLLNAVFYEKFGRFFAFIHIAVDNPELNEIRVSSFEDPEVCTKIPLHERIVMLRGIAAYFENYADHLSKEAEKGHTIQ